MMAMKEHPSSVWTLGGIPGGYLGVPSPADLEAWGRTWSGASDEYLIGTAARQHGVDTAASMPALIESHRRLKASIAAFEESTRGGSEALLAANDRLHTSMNAFSDCSSQQTAEVIRLTNTLKTLTWVLVGIGALQVILMFLGRS